MESAATEPGIAWPEHMLHYGANVLFDDSLGELLLDLLVWRPIMLDNRPPLLLRAVITYQTYHALRYLYHTGSQSWGYSAPITRLSAAT